jgi:hypothetical protein
MEDDDYLDEEALSPNFIQPDDSPFEREDLINDLQLRTSEYRAKALEMLKQTNLSYILKQELARWIHAFLSTDQILADNSESKNGILGKIRPKDKATHKARFSLKRRMYFYASHYDNTQPAFHTLIDDFMSIYEALISRTSGTQRERLLAGRRVSEVKSVNETVRQPVGEVKKKRWGL